MKKLRTSRSLMVGVELFLLVLFLAWSVFPVFWMLSMSFKTKVDAFAMPPKWVFIPILSNYLHAIQSRGFINFYLNSILIGLVSTFIVLAITVPSAYTLSRLDFARKKDLDFWILTTRMAPPVGILIPYFFIFRKLGLIDSRISIIVMHVAINLPLSVWVLKGFFKEVPGELEEAAFIDGSGRWGAFLRVILPLTAPGIGATGILCFILSWNELMFALTLSGTRSKTAPVSLYNFIAYLEIHWGPLMAAATLVLLPVMIFFIIVQRQLVKGLTFGALK